MKKISECKVGEIVRFADIEVEILKHHTSGCTVKPCKGIVVRIKDNEGTREMAVRTKPYQVSNFTEIEEIRLQDYLTELFSSVADSKELSQAHIIMLENKGG